MPARGRHVCAFGSTLAEQFDLAAPFLRAGLARGEKSVFFCHETDARTVAKELTARGVALNSPRRLGVSISSCEAAGLAQLPFSPARTIGRWSKEADAALAEGFAGLRVVVEMTWALYGGLERLAEYEAKSAALFVEKPLSALCHYNRLRFSEAVLRDAILAHPDLGVDGEMAGNPDYLPCDAFLALTRASAIKDGRAARSARRGLRTG